MFTIYPAILNSALSDSYTICEIYMVCEKSNAMLCNVMHQITQRFTQVMHKITITCNAKIAPLHCMQLKCNAFELD